MIRSSWNCRRRGDGSQVVLIILAVIGIIAVVGCVACGGCTVALVGLGGIFGEGGGLMIGYPEEIKRQVKDLPDVQRELGEIESIEENFFGSVDADDRFDSEDMWQFDVEGTKGSGKIFVESANYEDELRFTRRILETSNGQFDLGPTPDDDQPVDDEDPFGALRTSEGDGPEVTYPEEPATDELETEPGSE